MKYKALVTGGAGFVGSYIVDELIKKGHDVRILDNIEYQVHKGKIPDYLNKNAEYMFGDVLNRETLKKALEDVDVVFHEAAMVGVGQSMYDIARYVNVNTYGTALLLDTIVNGNYNLKKLLVASSMSIYGEGKYNCDDCGDVYPSLRKDEDMKKGEWEQKCPNCGKIVIPKPTDEEKPLISTSTYAQTKKHQEEMVLLTGKVYGIPSVALRYFNIFGPRQSLNNPYTGVCAIFSSRIKNNNSPVVYEDGNQARDFIHVKDIARANIMAMENKSADYGYFNVGTGNKKSILDIAEILINLYSRELKPEVTGQFRPGDIRHCYADITKIKEKIGFEPEHTFEKGMKELIEWAEKQEAKDEFEKVQKELKERGLISEEQ
ncbi:MAG: GDP-mannose 4,6-dehydratase [Candidatus Nanoarchaeia archaeon]|nr:GDP-mannose 4,6-dehydratase [Candidatus Nanoarchaeia archaeon]